MCFIEEIKTDSNESSEFSAELWLAVSGGQPIFTFGITYVCYVTYRLSVFSEGPSTNIYICLFCQKYHLKDTHKIFKKIHAGLKLESGV